MQTFLAALAVALSSFLSTVGGATAPSSATPTPTSALTPSPAASASAPAASAPAARTSSTSTGQLRAYFVDAFGTGMYDPSQIDAVVASAKAANMNAIVAQVVRRGDCFCNNASVPRTDAPIAPAPFDPLQTLIEKAHAQGLQVHAWMIVTGLWQGPALPKDPAHAFNLHGLSAS